MKIRKLLALTISLIIITSTVSAQPQGADIGESLYTIVDDIDQFLGPAVDINGFLDIMIWVILPIAGLSGLYYWLIFKSLRMAEKRANDNSSYGTDDKELTKRVAKLVGIMFGVGTYYYLATYLFWIFALALVGVLLVWLPWITGKYMNESTGGLPSIGGFGNNNQTEEPSTEPSRDGGGSQNSNGNEAWRERAQDIESDLEQMSNQIENLEGMEGRIQQTFNELRSDISEVEQETEQVSEELKHLARDVKDIDEFRQRMNNMNLTERQKKELNKIISEVDKVEELEEHIESNIEKIEQQEEKIEKQEERISQYEQKIEELEKQVINEFNHRIREIIEIEQEQERINNELNQLEQRISQGEMDREEFKEEIRQTLDWINDLETRVDEESDRVSNLEIETSKISEFLVKVMEGSDPEDLEDLTDRIKEIAERTEDEAEKGEQMEQEEEEEVKHLPAKIENVFGASVKEESQIINQEVYELSEEKSIVKYEDQVLDLEEQVEQGEVQIEKELKQEIQKLMSMMYGLAKAIQKDKERVQRLEEGEVKQHKVHEMEIKEILGELGDIDRGKTTMNPMEAETFAQEALKKIDQIQQETNDKQELEMIRRSREKAQQILEAEMQEEKEHKMLEEQDQERKALMSGETTPQQLGNELEKEVKQRLELAKGEKFETFDQVRQFWADNQTLIEDFQNVNSKIPEQQRNKIGDLLRELQEYLEAEAEKNGGSLGGAIR